MSTLSFFGEQFSAKTLTKTYQSAVFDGVVNREYEGEIQKAWWNAHVEGLALEDEMVTFPTIMGIVTETDPEEWS